MRLRFVYASGGVSANGFGIFYRSGPLKLLRLAKGLGLVESIHHEGSR